MAEPDLIAMDVSDHAEWTSAHVSIDAASLIGTAPAVVERLRRGALDWVLAANGAYLSLTSVLDDAWREGARRRAGLEEMIRVSEEAGPYDAELDVLREAHGET